MSEEHYGGRVPPHNLEAERAVVGALMVDPVRVSEVAEKLVPEDFYDQRVGEVYRQILELENRGVPIDLVNLGEALQAGGKLQQVGGRSFLIELASCVTSSAHVNHHAAIIDETSTLRKLITEATEILGEAYETRADGESVGQLLDQSEHRIFSIAGGKDTGGAEPISSAITETFRRIDSASGRDGVTGVPGGFYDLDDMLCGFNAGEMIIIAARPSMGKTAFVLNVMEHAALNRPDWLETDATVLFFSLEMGRQSICSRMLCSRARVDAHRLRTGKIPAEDYAELARAAGELSGAKLFIDDQPGISVMTMRSRARRVKATHGLHMIVVDYLQLMTHPKAENRQQEISSISRSLKELARELEVPVIALSQLSRAVESRDDKRPMLSDLRESGSIEQDADVVLLLYRPDYYNETEENKGLAEIIVAKQRNGPTGTVRLGFRGSILRFENRTPSLAEPILP